MQTLLVRRRRMLVLMALFSLVFATWTVPALGKTTITFWYPWGGIDGNLRAELAAQFSKEHPDIEVKPLLVSGSGYSDGKLMASIAGGQPPDVVLYWNGGDTGAMAARGGLTDLTPYLDTVGINAEEYEPAVWKQMQYRGRIWGIPEISAIYCSLFYNKDVFAAAGLDPDSPPVTLEEADLYAAKMTRINRDGQVDVAGFIPWMEQGSHTDFWMQIFGGKLFNEDETKVTADHPGNIEAFKWMASYGSKYGAKQFSAFIGSAQGSDSPQNPFYTGNLGMVVNGSWFATAILKYAPQTNFGIAGVPYPENGLKKPAYLGTNVWWVPRGSKHVKEALEFIAWMNDKERVARTADQVGNFAPIVAARNMQKLRTDKVFSAFFNILESGNTISEPNNPVWAFYNNELTKARDNVIFGRSTAEKALAEVTQKTQKELQKLLK